MSETTIYYTVFDSPMGPLTLTSNGCDLTGLYMNHHEHGPETGPNWVRKEDAAPLPEAVQQLREYFTGKRTTFDLPLDADGTDFQKRVWAELAKIPYGVTVSYGEMAERLGDKNASRAVGLANGRNPISIIVPCHRVIGANGKMVGYGGGLPNKIALLDFERAVLAQGPQDFVR